MRDHVKPTRRREGESLPDFLAREHREDHPDCTYGDQAHYVPPSFGQVGFYLCDVPEDLTDHSRVRFTPAREGAYVLLLFEDVEKAREFVYVKEPDYEVVFEMLHRGGGKLLNLLDPRTLRTYEEVLKWS